MADIDTKQIDWPRVAALLNVLHLQAQGLPRATHLGNAAASELMAINDAIKVASEQLAAPAGTPAEPTKPHPDPELQQKLELGDEKPKPGYVPFSGANEGGRRV